MRENAISQQLRVIPAQVRSLDGQIVDTSGDSWAFQSSFDGGQLLFPQLGGAETTCRFRCQLGSPLREALSG